MTTPPPITITVVLPVSGRTVDLTSIDHNELRAVLAPWPPDAPPGVPTADQFIAVARAMMRRPGTHAIITAQINALAEPDLNALAAGIAQLITRARRPNNRRLRIRRTLDPSAHSMAILAHQFALARLAPVAD